MTDNLARWHHYMKDVTSPDIYVTMGFYYMICAALQRRVYLGGDERPIFPNVYVIFVGDPGVGKGLVLKPVNEFLSHHKFNRLRLPASATQPQSAVSEQELTALIAEYQRANPTLEIPESILKQTQPKQGGTAQQRPPDDPLLIPIAPDATTYQALIANQARSIRSIVPQACKGSRLLKSGIYTHSSLAFVLEEISSLFRKNQDDVTNYLLKAFDCGDYRYETKTQGIEIVRNMCLNFLGGTTPSFMKNSFNDHILNDGFASRCLFVYAETNRFERFKLGLIDESQRACKEKLLAHIKALTELFGEVSYTPEAEAFMADYVEQKLPAEKKKAPPKLMGYFARKRILFEKLVLAGHFADNLTFTVQLETCEKMLQVLTTLEKKMELALDIGGRNPLSPVAAKVMRYLKANGSASEDKIWEEFNADINEKELREVMTFLINTKQVLFVTESKPPRYFPYDVGENTKPK